MSSLELTKQILERIEKYNPTLIAVVTLLKDEALNRARAADEALAKGEVWGPLHGVPCTVKDTLVNTSEDHTDFVWIKPEDIDFELKDHLIDKVISKLSL